MTQEEIKEVAADKIGLTMTKDEQIKMLKEQRVVLRASNEKFRKEFMDKACEWLKEHMHIGSPEKTGNIFATTFLSITPDILYEFRNAMDAKTEKPTSLTWEDVQSIVEIADEMIQTAHDRVKWEDSSPEAYYKEVLTKFNEKKYGKGI